jgi:hypothetical protein
LRGTVPVESVVAEFCELVVTTAAPDVRVS